MPYRPVPVQMAKELRAAGLSWRLVAKAIHARTGRLFVPTSIQRAISDAAKR